MKSLVNNSQIRTYFLLTIVSFSLAATLISLFVHSTTGSTYLLFQMNVGAKQENEPVSTIPNIKGKPPKIAPWIYSTRVIDEQSTTVGVKNSDENLDEKLSILPQKGAPKIDERTTETTTNPTFFVSNSTDELNASSPIVNPHQFSFILLQKDLCLNRWRDLFLIVIVHTAPENFKRRMFIRKTWGNGVYYKRLRMLVVFAMGVKEGNDSFKVQMRVAQENERYGDIIQEDFIDSYRNLTYKSIMWLKWATQYCQYPPFLLKVDDDVFVNSFNLIRHVGNMYKRKMGTQQTISCLVWNSVKVIRRKESKWYASEDEYAKDFYPTYCSGSAYLLSMDLVPQLYDASFYVKFFWIDDFYITGELARFVNATFNQQLSLYTVHGRSYAYHHEKLTDGYRIFAHLPEATGSQKYELWKAVLQDNERQF